MNIIILDDHKIFGESLKNLLLENKDITHCDFVSDVDRFYEKIEDNLYDICLLDVNLDTRSGFDVLRDLKAKKTNFKTIILSSYTNPINKKKALDFGAAAYLSKSIDSKNLIEKLLEINMGLSKGNEDTYENLLTNREEEVLKEIISGKTNSEIAKSLFISERTLYNHIEGIYNKLEVENKVELYSKSLELGYIEDFG